MSKDTLNNRFVPLVLSIIVGLGVFISLWPSNFIGFTTNIDYAQLLMFLFLGTGMLFFLMGKNKPMVICLTGCAFICYELNERTQSAFKPALTEHNELIRIGIYNLYPDSQELDKSLKTMCSSNTDLISIKTIPSHQFPVVVEQLGLCGYHFHSSQNEKHPALLKEVVFSKNAFAHFDTLYLPNLTDGSNFFSQRYSDKDFSAQQVFNTDELKYLKFEPVNRESDQQHMGIIQTYQFIHQEPAIHDKKTSQKL